MIATGKSAELVAATSFIGSVFLAPEKLVTTQAEGERAALSCGPYGKGAFAATPRLTVTNITKPLSSCQEENSIRRTFFLKV
jgi:hypothetical protein